jgi:hypothetical protein
MNPWSAQVKAQTTEILKSIIQKVLRIVSINVTNSHSPCSLRMVLTQVTCSSSSLKVKKIWYRITMDRMLLQIRRRWIAKNWPINSTHYILRISKGTSQASIISIVLRARITLWLTSNANYANNIKHAIRYLKMDRLYWSTDNSLAIYSLNIFVKKLCLQNISDLKNVRVQEDQIYRNLPDLWLNLTPLWC